jgi:hypothetical protein
MDATRRYLLVRELLMATMPFVSTDDDNDGVAAKSPSGLSPVMAKTNVSAKPQVGSTWDSFAGGMAEERKWEADECEFVGSPTGIELVG